MHLAQWGGHGYKGVSCFMRLNARYNSVISSRTIVRFAGIALIICLAAAATYLHLYRASQPVKAAAPLTFSLYATHPYASHAGFDNTSKNYYTNQFLCPPPQTFCPQGQTITDMGITSDGKLIAGYGEWTANVDSFGVDAGRVGVVPLDLSNGTWGSIFYAGSEAIETIREINGKIYVPTTDPSDKAATGNPSGNISGYITNETGPWTFVSNGSPANEHMFDVAIFNGSYYTSGARSMTAPTERSDIRVSTNGGTTWADSYTGTDTSGWGRSEWLSVVNGQLLGMKAWVEDPGKMVASDGTSWREAGSVGCSQANGNAHLFVSFDNHLVCGDTGGIGMADGAGSVSRYKLSSAGTSASGGGDVVSCGVLKDTFGGAVCDFYIYDGYLYALTNAGIIRTNSLSSPFEIVEADVPNDATSIAIYNDVIYLGADGGKIYKADMPTSEAKLSPPSIEACLNFNASEGRIDGFNGSGCASSSLVIPDTINGVAVTKIADYAFDGSKGYHLTSLSLPASVTSIGAFAFRDNQLASVSLPGATSIGDYAFENNNLTSVSLPSTTDIGLYAFSHNQLTSLFSPNVTNVGDSAFSNNQLSSLSLPSVVSIGNGAFSSNELKDITIGSSLATIGNYVLGGNNNIDSITYAGTTYTSADPNTDACFVFNESSNTITGFQSLDLETVKSGGGICMNQKLVIPQTINGVAVKHIGDYALCSTERVSFNALTLPEGLETIGAGAFCSNLLTSVLLPSTLQVLDKTAFVAQSPRGGSSWGDVPADVQAVYDSLWYTRLYTADPLNPQGFNDGIMSESWWLGNDANANGTQRDSLGGQIINPALVTVRYLDDHGNQLQPQETRAGIRNDGSVFGDYFTKSSAILAPIDPDNPTPEETADLAAGFAQYFRIGQTHSFTAPVIAGYDTPTPQTITLASGQTVVTFVYHRPANTSAPNAPNTGLRSMTGAILAIVTLTVILITLVVVFSLRSMGRHRIKG